MQNLLVFAKAPQLVFKPIACCVGLEIIIKLCTAMLCLHTVVYVPTVQHFGFKCVQVGDCVYIQLATSITVYTHTTVYSHSSAL
jgi:hypothetical protein